jgi:hypothetical protein
MPPFSVHPGPSLTSGDGSAVQLGELLPEGPCLFVTDKDVVRLGHAQESDPAIVAGLPDEAQRLVAASSDLYSRVKRLDEGNLADEPPVSPARALMGRLERGLSGH